MRARRGIEPRSGLPTGFGTCSAIRVDFCCLPPPDVRWCCGREIAPLSYEHRAQLHGRNQEPRTKNSQTGAPRTQPDRRLEDFKNLIRRCAIRGGSKFNHDRVFDALADEKGHSYD